MSHLDSEFRKQDSPAVRSIVTDQVGFGGHFSIPSCFNFFFCKFQGEQIYGTRCQGCGYQSERASKFLEIEINFSVSLLYCDGI
jgi:hypothetical protein